MLRVVRVVRMLKAARYVNALEVMGRVLRAKREALALSFFVMLMLLVLCSSLMYYAEHQAQPEKFPDIPSTMWWAVATLTTVGYGDVYPITAAGKVLGSVAAILGVGIFALPTGILGAGFVEQIERAPRRAPRCPRCGASLGEDGGSSVPPAASAGA